MIINFINEICFLQSYHFNCYFLTLSASFCHRRHHYHHHCCCYCCCFRYLFAIIWSCHSTYIKHVQKPKEATIPRRKSHVIHVYANPVQLRCVNKTEHSKMDDGKKKNAETYCKGNNSFFVQFYFCFVLLCPGFEEYLRQENAVYPHLAIIESVELKSKS